MKTPISLIIDDSTPFVHLLYYHIKDYKTSNGNSLLQTVPNKLLFEFCDVVEKYGIKGKFSVVPSPAGKGSIAENIDGFSNDELAEWLDTVNTHLKGNFSFCPEIITHYKTSDLKNGGFLEVNEKEWAKYASVGEMTEYISEALKICKSAGIICSGVTSPWDFGIENENVYAKAIVNSFESVLNVKQSWYFLHCIFDNKNIRPWVEYDKDGCQLVSIPATVKDAFWQTIDIDDISDEFISKVADCYITSDGKSGMLIQALENNCFPIMCTHWQSMFSNGKYTGVRALEVVAERIQQYLSDRVEWVDLDRQTVLAIKDAVKRPML